MTTIVNTHQAEAWNGYEGQHWADNADRYEDVASGVNEPLLAAAAIEAEDVVLDVGCGNGRTTLLAAGRAVDGYAVGIDLSAPMLASARASAAGQRVANVRFEQGDAQVHPFPTGAFDVAISRGGVMFFADHVAAFGNIGRALRPGGRLALACPQGMNRHQDMARAFAPLSRLIRRHSPAGNDLSGDDDHGPASLGDPARIHEVLTGAGFEKIDTTPVDHLMRWGDDADDAAGFIFNWGPVRFNLAGAEDDEIDEACEAVAEALRPYEGPDGVRVPGHSLLVTAVWPGTTE